MKLKYALDYKSIQPFDDIELPNFTVLTGVNGSGKTQLLEAISAHRISVDDLDKPRIKLFKPQNTLNQSFTISGRQEIDQFMKKIFIKYIKFSRHRDNINISNNLCKEL